MPRWGFRQKLQDPKGFAPEARPPPPTTEARQRHHPMKAEPGKKGARVRMRLRKAMLTPRGQRAGQLARGAARSPRFAAPALLSSREPSPMSFFRGPAQAAVVRF